MKQKQIDCAAVLVSKVKIIDAGDKSINDDFSRSDVFAAEADDCIKPASAHQPHRHGLVRLVATFHCRRNPAAAEFIDGVDLASSADRHHFVEVKWIEESINAIDSKTGV